MTGDLSSLKRQNDVQQDAGMTLVETIIAVGMLVIFTATVASVVSYTQRFLMQSETIEGTNTLLADNQSKGLLVDQHELQLAMDQLVDQLQQPTWSAQEILSITTGLDRCAADPVDAWNLLGPPLKLPRGNYKICLRSSSLVEPIDVVSGGLIVSSAVEQLENGSPPGIYVLQALPDQLDASTLPARRLFCRPRPFC